MKSFSTKRVTFRIGANGILISFPDRVVSRSKHIPKWINGKTIEIIQTSSTESIKEFFVVISEKGSLRPSYQILAKQIEIDQDFKIGNPKIIATSMGYRAEWIKHLSSGASISISSHLHIREPFTII
jgi:hypothetical protein